MKRFWRRKMTNNDRKQRELQESEERLKQTKARWPEVRRAERELDRLIERALRGGAT